MQHFMHFPASLMIETVVALGAMFFTLRMARDFVRSPWLWGLGTLGTSFVLHRVNDWVVGAIDLELTYAAPGEGLVGMMLPFAASFTVFVVTPLAIPSLLPNVPWHLRNQRAETVP